MDLSFNQKWFKCIFIVLNTRIMCTYIVNVMFLFFFSSELLIYLLFVGINVDRHADSPKRNGKKESNSQPIVYFKITANVRTTRSLRLLGSYRLPAVRRGTRPSVFLASAISPHVESHYDSLHRWRRRR